MTLFKNGEVLDLDPRGYEQAYICTCKDAPKPHVHKKGK